MCIVLLGNLWYHTKMNFNNESIWNKVCPNKYYNELQEIHTQPYKYGHIVFCENDEVYADVRKYPIIPIFALRKGVTLMPTDGLSFNQAYNKAIAFSKKKKMTDHIGMAFGDVHIKNGIVMDPCEEDGKHKDGTIKASNAQVYIDLLSQRLNDDIVNLNRDIDESIYYQELGSNVYN